MTIRKSVARGRPEIPEGQRRTVVTQFRVSRAERKSIERAAKTSKMPLSEWIRTRLLADANEIR